MTRTKLLVAITILVSCHDDPPKSVTDVVKEPNSPDVPDRLDVVHATGTDTKACAKLRELGCAEGAPKRGKCEDVFEHARTNEPKADRGATEKVSRCVAGATTVAIVRVCGSAKTLTFECPNK